MTTRRQDAPAFPKFPDVLDACAGDDQRMVFIAGIEDNACPSTHPKLRFMVGLDIKSMWLMRDAFLRQDRMDLWSKTSTWESPVGWARKNAAHVFGHCPTVTQYWAQDAQRNSFLVALDKALLDGTPCSSEDLLPILRGQPCARVPAVGNALARCLSQHPQDWCLLSPAWLGEEKSALRAQALSMGWHSNLLAGMCRRHETGPNSARWIAHMPYAHTLMLLDYCKNGAVDTELWDKRQTNKDNIWPMVLPSSTHPLDALCAQALLPYLGRERRYTLAVPNNVRDGADRIPAVQVRDALGLVQFHMALGMVDALMAHFTRQCLMAVPDGRVKHAWGAMAEVEFVL